MSAFLGFALLIMAFVCANLSVFVKFLFGNFFTVDCHARMLDAGHPACNVASFNQIVCRDCKFDFSAVTNPAMPSVTHNHVKLHFNYPFRSFCIYYNRLVDDCQVKILLINWNTIDFTENKDCNAYESDYPPHFPFIHFHFPHFLILLYIIGARKSIGLM